MAKELIYKDFDMLAVGGQDSGIEVYKEKDYYLVCQWSIYHSGADMFRLKEPVDWSDTSALGKANLDVEAGVIEGQVYYKGHWYDTKMIRKIQKDRQDYNWKYYVAHGKAKKEKLESKKKIKEKRKSI